MASPNEAHSSEAIRDWIIHRVAAELRLPASDIDPTESFDAIGLSSREAVSLSGDLEEYLARKLSPTLLWEHPTIDALAKFLAMPACAAAETDSRPDEPHPHDPIAIVGIGCRFPGANGPASFWRLVRDGVDAVREIPPDRWDVAAYYDPEPARRGKMYTRRGGFLDHVDRFDAEFFGISPREADRMDPQQRLVLEVAWEALEDAGIAPTSLAGSRTGVFLGISSSDYAAFQNADVEALDAYAGTGNAHSIAANRLSYFLDLRGPSIAVDTACSSSLVAVHQAVQSLRNGESTLALAGGVNVILTPEINVIFSHARMMAADGRCKTFDASADGYVRGEGCGIIVLKRLRDALADGDPIYAVVRGSAVNHDGRSNGLTAPNGLAQQEVIRRALTDGRVAPSEIGYLEAHGTGTALGDPIEVEAIKAVLLEGRTPTQSCALGSVKTNIGHLEAAAGIAGLIKTALTLRHGEVPPHRNLTQLNPLIEIDGTPFTIPTEPRPWPAGDRKRYAGVSSFGFGGANAHVVLEEPPADTIPAEPFAFERPLHVLTLSARTPEALKRLAQRYAESLQAPDSPPIANVAFAANTGRAVFEHRFAVRAASAPDAARKLAAFVESDDLRDAVAGTAPRNDRSSIAFLFTGQGAQYVDMGRQLFETQPVFRAALMRCDEILWEFLGRSLLGVMYPGEGRPSLLDETAYTQPGLFAIEYALAETWKSWGIVPSAVMGHSVGEYVAACVAGVFRLEDGLRLIAERARLMQSTPHGGAMAAVLARAETVDELVRPYEGRVSIAAYNGPTNIVISGEGNAIDSILQSAKQRAIRSIRLNVSHAFHSPLMDPILDPFEAFASKIAYRPAAIPLILNQTGVAAPAAQVLDARYWREHLRRPVQFEAGIRALAEAGFNLFLEVGPAPILSGMGARCLPRDAAVWLSSLAKDQDDWVVMLHTLQELYARGFSIDWRGFDRGYPRRRLSGLPTYPFEPRRHWFDPPRSRNAGADSGPRGGSPKTDCTREPNGAGANGSAVCMYTIHWIEKTNLARDPASRPAGGRWLIFADGRGTGDSLARHARAKGIAVTSVYAGDTFAELGNGAYRIKPSSRDDLDRVMSGGRSLPDRVVYLWGMDADKAGPATDRAACPGASACAGLQWVVEALARAPIDRPSRAVDARRLWVVTRGAQPVLADQPKCAPEQAPLWGLGRTIALEHPEWWGGLIDLDAAKEMGETERLFREIATPEAEDQVALRGGRRFVPRLQRKNEANGNGQGHAEPIQCSPDAAYLITGGTGGLGLVVAEWLASRGAKHLVLLSRSAGAHLLDDVEDENGAQTGSRGAAIRRLRERGVHVRLVGLDVADECQMDRFLADYAASGNPPIRGVIHLAGVLEEPETTRENAAAVRAVFRPKVDGARVLHSRFNGAAPERSAAAPQLDFFVMFSSAAALLGLPGQANYAAANAYLDALAHYRRSQGLPALSINWGPWGQVGILARSGEEARLSAFGLECIAPEDGLAALETLLSGETPQVSVLPAEYELFLAQHPTMAKSPFLSGLLPDLEPATSSDTPGTKRRPAGRSRGATDVEAVEAYLRKQVALVLHRDEESLPIDRNFIELGVDSLMMMEVLNSVERDLGLKLYPKEVFDRPNIAALAAYVATELERTEHEPGAAAPRRGFGLAWSGVRLRKLAPPVRNAPAAFLLSAPRSGSTLLRVMLAGHPDLFCPPELHLLGFNTMREWNEALSESYLHEGLQQALMRLHGLDADAARRRIEDLVGNDLPIQEVYAALQTAAKPRLLVDKSPSYAISMETLENAERLFDRPKYIHLVRHPYAMVESFVRNRIDRMFADGDGDALAMGEEVWSTCNANILDFRSQIDPDRHLLVRYEDLVSKPEETMRRVCAFLGVAFDPAVLRPYDGERMTRGVHAQSRPIGDPNFLTHSGIDPKLGEAWRGVRLPRRLGGFARRVAAELEYPLPIERPHLDGEHAGVSPHVDHLLPIQPKGSNPPLYMCAPSGGMCYMYFNLAEYLGDDQPLYGLQDPALDPAVGMSDSVEELCARHVRAIREIQPKGPYYLGGWSFGGAVAFEMAQQLVAAGEEVGLLVILDTEARVDSLRPRSWKDRAAWVWGQLKMGSQIIFQWGPYAKDFIYIILPSKMRRKRQQDDSPSLWEYIRWAWADGIRHVFLKRADIADVVSRDKRVLLVRQPSTRRVMRVLSANIKALMKYEFKPYSGTITLLRVEDQALMHKLHDDPLLGWGELAPGRVEVVPVPGNHAVMLAKPYLDSVGAAIHDALVKAQARYKARAD